MEQNDIPGLDLRSLERTPGWILRLLVLLGVAAASLLAIVANHLGLALWGYMSGWWSHDRSIFFSLPLGQQIGIGLICATVALLLVLAALAGKISQLNLTSRGTQSDVSTVMNATVLPQIKQVKEQGSIIESGVDLLREAEQQNAEQLRIVRKSIAEVIGIISGEQNLDERGDGRPGSDRFRYGPPNDLFRLVVPADYITQEATFAQIIDTFDEDVHWRGALVYGPSCIGKTSTVAAAVRSLPSGPLARFPDGLVYVDAREIPEPSDVLRKIIQRFDPFRKRPPVGSEMLNDLAQARLRDKSALIVIDNVADSSRFLPHVTMLSGINYLLRVIVITTQKPAADGADLLRRVSIDYFSPIQARELFLRCYGISEDLLSAEDHEYVTSIIESLGCFQFAVAQYGKQAQALGQSLHMLAEQLRNHPLQDGGDERVRNVYADSLEALAALHPKVEKLLISWGAFGTSTIGRQALDVMAQGMGIEQPDAILNVLRTQLIAGPVHSPTVAPESDHVRWQVHSLMFDFLKGRFDAWPPGQKALALTLAAAHFAQYVAKAPLAAIAIDELAIMRAASWTLEARTPEHDEYAVKLGLALARFWRSRWDNERSFLYLPRLIDVANRVARRTNSKDDQLRLADLNLLLGRAIRHAGRLPKAEEYFRRDLRIRRSKKTRDERGEAEALYYLGQLYRIEGRLGKAEAHAKKALALATIAHDNKLIGLVVGELGRIARIRGKTSDAERHFQYAFKLLTESGEMLDAGVQLGYLGRTARMRGDLPTAQRYFEQSYKLALAADDARGQGVVLSYLARIARTRGVIDHAEDLFHQSLKIARRAGDTATQASVLGYLGRLQYTRGDLVGAKKLFFQSYQLSLRTFDGQNAAMMLGYIGRIHRAQGHWLRALVRRLQGLYMVYHVGDRRGQALMNRQMARFALQLGLMPLANFLANAAEDALTKAQDLQGTLTTRLLQAQIAAAKGDLDRARTMFEDCRAAFGKLESVKDLISNDGRMRVCQARAAPTQVMSVTKNGPSSYPI
ncbi:MAG TPA: tetratricopeptide repeat protein, partial [Ktedonobacterales bacterium]|nr:tetratricopeptide repeat protein [Ktedonobacterales bacterium]